MIGVTQDDLTLDFGPRWMQYFKSKCISGFQIRDVNKVYFMAVPDGKETVAPDSPDETNIVTSKNRGNGITNAAKAARWCSNDVALPKFNKKK